MTSLVASGRLQNALYTGQKWCGWPFRPQIESITDVNVEKPTNWLTNPVRIITATSSRLWRVERERRGELPMNYHTATVEHSPEVESTVTPYPHTSSIKSKRSSLSSRPDHKFKVQRLSATISQVRDHHRTISTRSQRTRCSEPLVPWLWNRRRWTSYQRLFWRHVKKAFSTIICHLVKLSFEQTVFLDRFKIAQVTPLLKKDGLSHKFTTIPQISGLYRIWIPYPSWWSV